MRLLTKLLLKFSALNEHKFRHNFDSLTPFCACGNDMEDNEHFLLRCPQFDVMRQEALARSLWAALRNPWFKYGSR